MNDLSNPAAVMDRLSGIEQDLAQRQNELEQKALAHFLAKRDREQQRAECFLSSTYPTVAERSAVAERETALIDREEEAAYEALRAVVRVLEARSNIGMAILKAQGRP